MIQRASVNISKYKDFLLCTSGTDIAIYYNKSGSFATYEVSIKMGVALLLRDEARASMRRLIVS